jgi:dTDP-4-dehydrorhamnose reductase
MRVLVTGTAGQLARSLAAAAGRDVEVVCVGRPQLDLAAPTGLASLICHHRPDLVVNAAAYTAVDKAESEPDLAHTINAAGAEAMARACADAAIPLVHMSTDYIFAGVKPEPYVESDATGPATAYGRSKLEGELRVRAACPRHLILRTAWVHSPYGHNFVKTMLRLAAARPEISVVDDQWGSPTYAPHLATAVLRIASSALHADGPWGTYHVVGKGETTWCGLAREVFSASGAHGGPGARVIAITTAEFPTPARRPANSRLDCTKLANDYDVMLPHWRDGVADCVLQLLAT